MYICTDCSSIFTIPAKFDDDEVNVHYDICPHCRSDEIEEAEECYGCDRFTPISKLTKGFCEKSKRDVVKRFQQLLDGFTVEQRALLNEVYEGEAF